ncbi:MAG: DUF5103 domain-containing protein [Muribaculaceae bacterium]|jgi:hypothetical protein
MRRFLPSLLMLLLPILAAAAPAGPDTSTAIFSPGIRSLAVNIEGAFLAPPVLTLGGDSRLVIGFDVMGEERQYLRYSILHCDADWSLGELVDSEVFDGFNYADIEDYAFSRLTTAHYVHYTIHLPNSDFQFKISGNYLLRVYPEDAPEEILLQVRFMVQEGVVSVGGTVTSRTDIDYNDSHQQLSLDIDTRNTRIRDINTDLRVVVTQNGRLDNAVVLSHPSRLMGSRAIYEHLPALIFPAGNEYRRMETVNNLYPGMGVDHIEYHAPWYHHILNLDKPRAHREYRYDSTQHGRYLIREYNAEDSDVEADYAMTLFTLDMLRIPDAEVYLDGDFMHRRLDSSSRMEYNPSTGRYEKLLPLKQGAYNYQYLVVPDGATHGLTAPVEGDHYQTVNEYLVYVYYRAPGDRYDRLLGVGALFSGY